MADRPIFLKFDADTTGLQQGIDRVETELGRVPAAAEAAGTDAGQNLADGMGDGMQSRADMLGEIISGFVTVELAMELGQRLMDGIAAGMESRAQAARDALDAIVGTNGEGTTGQEQYQSGLAVLGGGNANQGAAVAQRLGLSPAQVAAMASGQVQAPSYASGLLNVIAGTTGGLSNMPGGQYLLDAVGLGQTADAQAALAMALDRNTAALQAPGIAPYTGYQVPGVNGAAPSASPTWSQPAWAGASGSATVPTRG